MHLFPPDQELPSQKQHTSTCTTTTTATNTNNNMRVTRHPLLQSYLTYTLGKDLYVPLTSRCNTKTLPETRGPNFVLPAPVVAALCRVRDVEHGTQQWHHWCLYLDSHEGPQTLPAAMEPRIAKQLLPNILPSSSSSSSNIASAIKKEEKEEEEPERRPRIQDLLTEIKDQLQQHTYQSIVLAGEGEPTLRLPDLIELVEQLKQLQLNEEQNQKVPPIRLTTNGLVQQQHDDDDDDSSSHNNVPEQLKAAGISKVSVALMTHSPEQYDALMTPLIVMDDDNDDDTAHTAHGHVCQFIRQSLQAGLEVETTAVDYYGVDKEATERLSRDVLQVSSPVRWRPYFE
jgi:organic radical activating enzyme